MTRYSRSILTVLLCILGLFVTPRADAADWFVDSAGGNDASNGASPGTAWKTITHALVTLSSVPGPATIHLAPGTYDETSGETFPLVLRDQQHIVGDAGAAVTFVAGNGLDSTAFSITSDIGINPGGITSATGLSGLTIHSCAIGIDVLARVATCEADLHDLVFHSSARGIHLVILPRAGMPNPIVSMTLARLKAEQTGVGVMITSSAFFQDPAPGTIRVLDSRFAANGTGLHMTGNGRAARLEIERSSFVDHTNLGIAVAGGVLPTGATGATVILRGSLVARNVVGGARLDSGFVATNRILGCTFVDNAGYGLRAVAVGGEIVDTIAWGNDPDLQSFDPAAVRHSDIGTPSLAGMQGSIHADPQFVSAVNGDYRLRFGSPCVDSGDPMGSTPTDLTGTSRRMDGNLDTQRAPDMGAFELQTLRLAGTPSLGAQIAFEFLGSGGASSTLFVAHAAPVAPQSTPFGMLYLPPAQTAQSATVVAQSGPPYVLRRRIPNNPSLIGTTHTFQALTDSVLAPSGRAYTNPVTFIILP